MSASGGRHEASEVSRIGSEIGASMVAREKPTWLGPRVDACVRPHTQRPGLRPAHTDPAAHVQDKPADTVSAYTNITQRCN